MKKNMMLRTASVLLIAVLMSTCAISGTFAKYVTSAEGTDSARVAKWGVTITPNGALFEKQYGKNDDTYTLGDDTVVSNDTWNVVAPGTTDSLTEIVLAGTPEVATRVTYDATVTLGPWVLSDSSEYCPVYFTIESVTYGIDDHCGISCDVKATSVADLAAKIETAIEACKKDYEPNTNLSTVTADYPSVSWTWKYYIDDAHDVKDTELGNLAAGGYHSMIQIEIKTTVTQID